MLWIAGIAAVVALVLIFARDLIMALVEMVWRVVLGTLLAAAIGIVAGIWASGEDLDGGMIGVLSALVAVIPAIWLVGRERSRRAGRRNLASRETEFRPIDPPRPAPAPSPEDRYGLTRDARLGDAWRNAARLAPSYEMNQARDDTARFLAKADSATSPDMDLIEYAAFIRRHVPELVHETEAVADISGEAEREETIAEMERDLLRVGHDARRRLQRFDDAARSSLAIRRRRFAMQFGRDQDNLD
ncbi:hypothetical protein GCM10022600_28380 [Qipengyuania pelagi]